jgi:two-component system chemotaxis response regulator CheY
MRFVVADDSPIPRDILRRILTQAGHEVVGVADNGKTAIELCRQVKPDAVILDVSMPVMTGDVAALAIMDEQLARHVIIASSMALSVVFDPLRARGCAMVAKPYHSEQLLKALQAIL